MMNDDYVSSPQPYGIDFGANALKPSESEVYRSIFFALASIIVPMIVLAVFNLFIAEKYRPIATYASGAILVLFIFRLSAAGNKHHKQLMQLLVDNGFHKINTDIEIDAALTNFSPLRLGNRTKVHNHYMHTDKRIGTFSYSQKVGSGKRSKKRFQAAYVQLDVTAPHIIIDDVLTGDGTNIFLQRVSNYKGVQELEEYDMSLHGDQFKSIRILLDVLHLSKAKQIINALVHEPHYWLGMELEIHNDYIFAVSSGQSNPRFLFDCLENVQKIVMKQLEE